jgi:PHD/YefM family antitoxin component YafN of YafNO toxin-antitoxin module
MRYGDPKAVLIAVDAFEELLDRIHLKAELEQGEKQSKGEDLLRRAPETA